MTDELACVYAALLLQDDDILVTGEKIQTVLKAAKVEVESYWPTLFSKALETINLKDLVANVGSGVGSCPAPAATPATPATAAPATDSEPKDSKKEEKKKEEVKEEESDDDMGFGLFE